MPAQKVKFQFDSCWLCLICLHFEAYFYFFGNSEDDEKIYQVCTLHLESPFEWNRLHFYLKRVKHHSISKYLICDQMLKCENAFSGYGKILAGLGYGDKFHKMRHFEAIDLVLILKKSLH